MPCRNGEPSFWFSGGTNRATTHQRLRGTCRQALLLSSRTATPRRPRESSKLPDFASTDSACTYVSIETTNRPTIRRTHSRQEISTKVHTTRAGHAVNQLAPRGPRPCKISAHRPSRLPCPPTSHCSQRRLRPWDLTGPVLSLACPAGPIVSLYFAAFTNWPPRGVSRCTRPI